MKRILAAILLVVVSVVVTHADDMDKRVDEMFEKTNKWLASDKVKDAALVKDVSSDDNRSIMFDDEDLMFVGKAAGNPDHRTPAQRKLMAERAAEVLAQRNALEYLSGVAIAGATTCEDMMAKSDQVRTAVSGILKGAKLVFTEYTEAGGGEAIALIQLSRKGKRSFASVLYDKMLNDPKFKDQFKTDAPSFKAPPTKLDVAYDGLIIDATEQNFRPALINRIFATKGDILYDPAKVSQKVLVEQGCGEYTNNVNKAKAALETRGVKNPLVVKASGATSVADLQVTDDDALTIYSANQKGNFFSAAKVAFVLK